MARADLVVSHAGAGSIMEALGELPEQAAGQRFLSQTSPFTKQNLGTPLQDAAQELPIGLLF